MNLKKMDKKILSISDAASILGVSDETVGVLKEIGRELLGRFFGQVGGGGNGKQLELPPASARLSPIVI